jgi:hypothetical protein
MPDLTTISTLLGSIKTATDLAKLIKDSDVSLEKAETKLKLAELINALADAKIEIAGVQELLIEKDKAITGLQESLEVKNNLKWEKPYYWLEQNGTKEGPFCQHCYDNNNKLLRLQGDGDGYWYCTACKNNYTDSNYQDPGPLVMAPDYDPY